MNTHRRNFCLKAMLSGVAFVLLVLPVLATDGMVGKAAPEWHVTNWMNSPELRLADLRGKVVLVRWWTAPDCPYCRATAPALNEFYDKYHAEGLEVIGFYHHKAPEPLRIEQVA